MPDPAFAPVNTRVDFPAQEEAILAFWRERDIFRKSVANRAGAPQYTFYEGPPTANGTPGIHHVLARVFKDVILRYRTMRGEFVPRRGGWDTHGLPVELEIEKQLGFTGKQQIEEYGIEAFNRLCRESVFRYVEDWERLTERIAFWIDMENAYVTYANDYIETCWWIIHRLWEQGLAFQDYKVTPHCPRCDTSLSSHEVALGYKDDTDDPSLYVRLRLRPDQPALPPGVGEAPVPVSFLAWTTTPWTLPGNVALALAPQADYAVCELDTGAGPERIFVADALRHAALRREHTVVAVVKGAELTDARYEPLYDRRPDRPAYRVVTDSFVSLEEGTGIVHIAPAFGAADLDIGRKEDLPIVITVDLKGTVAEDLPGGGRFVKDADPLIARDLEARGLLYRAERIKHTYPFCWRCDTPLLYYAKTSWYLKTTAVKGQLLAGNEAINWYPEHIKTGRFGDWLANNVDWAISRERYWGTPLNIWRCSSCGQYECVDSLATLAARAGKPELVDRLDLHRPYVDEVVFACRACGGEVRRVPEVVDAWFDSGAMPYAQQHYPFGDEVAFWRNFPADFICEGVDQTRGWFYSLHALGTLLFQQPVYRNVICLGHILDARGDKMSKSRGNVVNPWDVIAAHGVDALRWYMYSATPAGQPRRFSADLVGEVVRKFVLTLWNTYAFFVLYANLDGWRPGPPPDSSTLTPLDRWVRAELARLVLDVTDAMEAYDPTTATRRIQEFVDHLSNWYVRRSRRRFWKSDDPADKAAAYATLHECLTTVARLCAPFAPFLAEAIYRNLVHGVDAAAPESVHCADWPTADTDAIDEPLMAANRLAMRVVALGRAARARANLKVRQPVQAVLIKPRNAAEAHEIERFADVIRDELNSHEVRVVADEMSLVRYSLKPNLKALGPRFGQSLGAIQTALREANAAAVVDHFRTHAVIELGGFSLEREDVLVEYADAPDVAAAVDSGYVVAVTTALTPELVAEGQVREIVRHIQDLRKTAGFAVSDRIETWVEVPPALLPALQSQSPYLQEETLTTSLQFAPPPEGVPSQQIVLDGAAVAIGVRRVDGHNRPDIPLAS